MKRYVLEYKENGLEIKRTTGNFLEACNIEKEVKEIDSNYKFYWINSNI